MLGPDDAYNMKNENNTKGGSKEMKEITRAITNKNICGTLCLILKSLKL
tara:strand:+ start:569 stop:715 length:147 start_codon:yes stop_codon:yes gene_type:complete